MENIVKYYAILSNIKCKYFSFVFIVLVIHYDYGKSANFSSHQVTCKTKTEWFPLKIPLGNKKLGHMKYRFEYPMVIVTLKYHIAAQRAWDVLSKNNALNAVKAAISFCEIEAYNCTGVGYGKNPDESGEPTLDATLFDGKCVCAGAVGNLRRIKSSINAAEVVLKKSHHQVLLGNTATKFVSDNGLVEECIITTRSECQLKLWKKGNCQPNYWRNTVPNPIFHCGPYKPIPMSNITFLPHHYRTHFDDNFAHDSMGVIAIDKNRSLVAGTSSCGGGFKIPGKISLSAIPGSGTFADNRCCACVAIGWGDHLIKFAPAALTCDLIRQGFTPMRAAKRVVARIWSGDSRTLGAIIAVSKKGEFGVACVGIHRPVKYFHSEWKVKLGTFPYVVRNNFGSRRYWVTCEGELKALNKTVPYRNIIYHSDSTGSIYE